MAVGGGPDAFDAGAGADEKSGGGERYESHQESVFDQVLALFVEKEVADVCHEGMLAGTIGFAKLPKVRILLQWEA